MTYDEYLVELRRHGSHCPAIVILFGSAGSRYAAVRWGRGKKSLQVRSWSASSKKWSRWRRLYAEEFQRVASPADVTKFKPDYGVPWDRNL